MGRGGMMGRGGTTTLLHGVAAVRGHEEAATGRETVAMGRHRLGGEFFHSHSRAVGESWCLFPPLGSWDRRLKLLVTRDF
jgi:hypothetical protein